MVRCDEGLRFQLCGMIWEPLGITDFTFFTIPKVMMGITTEIWCQNGLHGPQRSNFSSSSYHSHPLYFASTTLTRYVNPFYPWFVTLAMHYSPPINIHVVDPPFMSPCFIYCRWLFLCNKGRISLSLINMFRS
jgi:hypothetical protein